MRKPAATTDEIRAVIAAIVDNNGSELVAAYYDPSSSFAGALFDEYGENPSGRFTSDDVVAASLLDVRFGPPAIRALLINREFDDLLESVPDEPLWESDVSPDSTAWVLWDALINLPDVGGTRASKLMARKRSRLFPVLDSVVRDHLKLGNMDAWGALKDALAIETLRSDIDAIAPRTNTASVPSTLRLLDVVTWMRYSQSSAAKAARQNLGM